MKFVPRALTRTPIVTGILSLLLATSWAVFRAPLNESFAAQDLLVAAKNFPIRSTIWSINFYQDSPILILLTRLLHIESTETLVRLCLLLAMCCTGSMLMWTVVSTRGDGRWRAGRLAVLGPITTVLFASLGSYDSVTVLCWMLCLTALRARSRALVALAAVPLGIQHFEQGVFGTCALVLTCLALQGGVLKRVIYTGPQWIIPGLCFGMFMLVMFFLINHQVPVSRAGWYSQFGETWTRLAIVTLPILIWSLFAGLWPVVITICPKPMGTSNKLVTRACLAGAFACGLAATFLTGDRPRVFVIVMLPALLVTLVAYMSIEGRKDRLSLMAEAVAWLAPPVLLFKAVVVNVDVFSTSLPAVLHIAGLG